MTKNIELKGGSFTLSVLHLLDNDLDNAATFLAEKVKQAPAFFENAPLVVDISRLDTEINFRGLKKIIDNSGMLVVGISGCKSYETRTKAKKAGLAVLSAAKQARDYSNKSSNAEQITISDDDKRQCLTNVNEDILLNNNGKPDSEHNAQELIDTTEIETTRVENLDEGNPQREEKIEEPILSELKNTPKLVSKIITAPVRSGQQIYAKNTDLIILGNVSQGAEIISDGCIHVYGVLRGRAIAGANGNQDAYIFCQNLQPELISVAGHYWLSDAIPEKYASRAVKISLNNDSLNIDYLTL